MKKLLLFTCILTFNAQLFGQSINNGSFENWNATYYDELTGWYSGNQYSMPYLGIPVLTKVTGQSGSAMRLETSIIGTDTTFAYIVNTDGDPEAGEGGVPYSQQPTALTGFYRYNLPGNDTAWVWVIFKKSGAIVSNELFPIRGTGSQPTFTQFSFPLTLSVVPDSVIFAATCSNLINEVGIQHGSFLELDQLAFTGTGITQQMPNSDFENWTVQTLLSAADWSSWGEDVKQTTDKYAGTYAIMMATFDEGGGNMQSSGISNGIMSQNGPVGGRPYTNTVDTLRGYYKYLAGNDTAQFMVILKKNGSTIDGYNYKFLPTSNYTAFEIPMATPGGTSPDTILIVAESSTWPFNNGNNGDELYLDDLWLTSDPLGIQETFGKHLESSVFPNPVANTLHVKFEADLSENSRLTIYDASGKKVQANEFTRTSYGIRTDVSHLNAGIYYYEIRTAEGRMKNKFVKQ